MATYTFAKVERYVEKSVPCTGCGKRLRRKTTLYQTLNPFNKAEDGRVKGRQQLLAELDVKAKEWQAEPTWCQPCYAASHIPADDLVVGDVIVLDDGREITVAALERTDDGRIITNPGTEDFISGRPWGHVTIRPRA